MEVLPFIISANTVTGLHELFDAIQDQQPVSGLTHNFYRYPARFAPSFARQAILNFTEPGDLVYDPFMGGGTSLVEARALGRRAVGTDVSSLAVFLSQAKTTILTCAQLRRLTNWGKRLISKLNVRALPQRPQEWLRDGYQRNIGDRLTWRLRKLLEIGVADIPQLPDEAERKFARCALLRIGQWALDCREHLPSVEEFRRQFLLFLDDILVPRRQAAENLQIGF